MSTVTRIIFTLWIIGVHSMFFINDKELENQTKIIDSLRVEILQLNHRVDSLNSLSFKLQPKTRSVEVTVTIYNALEAQCNSDFLTTASGRKIKSTDNAYDHKFIAVSRNLLKLFPYGSRVLITGTGNLDGEYIVADTMNSRFIDYVDILINPDMNKSHGGKWFGKITLLL